MSNPSPLLPPPDPNGDQPRPPVGPDDIVPFEGEPDAENK